MPAAASTTMNDQTLRALSFRVEAATPPRTKFVPPTDRPAVVLRDGVNAPGNAVVAAVYSVDGIDATAIAAEIAMLPELLRLRDAVLGNQFGDSLLELARNAQPSAV